MLMPWLLVSIAVALTPPKPTLAEPNGSVMLDGVKTAVHWDDGDTFLVPSTRLKARLDGYNTLESYGAVHRFGPGEKALFGISKRATELARSQAWRCEIQEGSGGYGRKRVDCPDLRKAMLEQGLAHVFAIGDDAEPADLEAQRVGIEARVGMWVEGAPKGIVTSAHSLDEKPGQQETYNRVMNLETGAAPKVMHKNVYAACDWVCVDDACLLYVPYTQRYGPNRASCLMGEE
jgi:endonuclease YncB( thermonuclease family)